MKRIFAIFAAACAAFMANTYALAQDGITPTSIVIGQSAAFTGPAAQLGIQMRDGAKLWFDQINAQGGINGRRIELRSRDDKYESKLAAENTKKLITEDRVFLLFAYVGTPTSQASLPIFTEARVPFVAPFTGAELLRTPFNRYIFNVRASYFDETEKIVEQLTRTGIKRFAVFYQNDAYGQAGLEGVKRALARRNIPIAALGTVERNTTNVADAVKTISAAQPEATIMISAYTSVAEFVRQMKASGSISQYFNVSFVGSKALAEALGKDGHGVMISQVVPFPGVRSRRSSRSTWTSPSAPATSTSTSRASRDSSPRRCWSRACAAPARSRRETSSSPRWSRCRTSRSAALPCASRRRTTTARNSSSCR
jgi:ABC-type branched-subunit amino acid transport system substrate-binding protein